METYIPDESGHIDLPGNTATYPPGYKVFFLHGQFAGMEAPALPVLAAVPAKTSPKDLPVAAQQKSDLL